MCTHDCVTVFGVILQKFTKRVVAEVFKNYFSDLYNKYNIYDSYRHVASWDRAFLKFTVIQGWPPSHSE